MTLLLDGSHLEGLGLSTQAALVTDAALGERVAALIAQWQRPVRSAEQRDHDSLGARATRGAQHAVGCRSPPADQLTRSGCASTSVPR